eukprot:g279.t1
MSSKDDRSCENGALALAAERIKGATFLLVTAGAGFSADSGLAVYKDIADVAAYRKMGLDYSDLCEPSWIERDSEVFLGFWGSCINKYRTTKPHAGYDIIRRWRDTLFAQRRSSEFSKRKASRDGEDKRIEAGYFFVYTSNVDHHFVRAGFRKSELYEIHGTVEEWQCADPHNCDGIIASSSAGSDPDSSSWKFPENAVFDVDTSTMRCRSISTRMSEKEDSTPVMCRRCGRRGRPSVLMFRDEAWTGRKEQEKSYVEWEAKAERALAEDNSLSLVVLELGCGERVPHVRRESEMVVEDILRTQMTSNADRDEDCPSQLRSCSKPPPYVCAMLIRQRKTSAGGREWCALFEKRGTDARVAAGQLTCFGGKVEDGETATEALRRELREEMDWEPAVLSPAVDLYVDGDYIARFYAAEGPSFDASAAQEEDREAVWLNAKDIADLESCVSPWHVCVFQAWTRGDSRAYFDSDAQDRRAAATSGSTALPLYVRHPQATLIRINPLESGYEHKNSNASHIVPGIQTIEIRSTALRALRSIDARLQLGHWKCHGHGFIYLNIFIAEFPMLEGPSKVPSSTSIALWNYTQAHARTTTVVRDIRIVKDISSTEQYDKAVSEFKGHFVAVFFYADFHEPSKRGGQMDMLFAQLGKKHAEEGNCLFLRVDAEEDDCEDLTERYSVTSVPTFVFVDPASGKVLSSVAGADPQKLSREVQNLASKVSTSSSKDDHSASDRSSETDKLNARIKKLINAAHVMLFMKGSPSSPYCKFSRKAVELLKSVGAEYGSYDILKDNDVRQGIKTYSNWKTFPQLYVGGKLIGGHDIIVEMAEEGELKKVVCPELKPPPVPPVDVDARIRKIIASDKIVLFMKGDPDTPRCGFSRRIVKILRENDVKFSSFDILQDEDVRQRIKVFSNWPTFPQLYASGKLIGGLDIVTELVADGELADALSA